MSPPLSTSVLLLCPVFNEDQHLDSLIKSLKQQTWTDWILVLGDNASNDGSTQKIRIASQHDSRIRAILYSEHLTVHESFNRTIIDALESYSSKYIQIIAADDCFAEETSLQDLVSVASTKSGSFVAGNMIHFDNNGPLENNDFRFFEPINNRSLRKFAMEQWGANLMYSLFARHEFEALIFHPIARFSSNLASDWWFSWVAVNSLTNPVFIETVTYKKFRKSEGFSSPRPKSNAFLALFSVFQQCLMRIGDRRGYIGKVRSAGLFFLLAIAEVRMLTKSLTRTTKRID